MITVDRLDRLAEAVRIARRPRRIALQSVIVGMGLSLVAMVVAAFGFLPPVAGAHAPGGDRRRRHPQRPAGAARRHGARARVPGWTELAARLRPSTGTLAPALARIRPLADRLDTMPPAEALVELQRTRTFLVDALMPHEQDEDRTSTRSWRLPWATTT